MTMKVQATVMLRIAAKVNTLSRKHALDGN